MPFNTPFAQPLESETDHLKVAEQNLAFVTELLKRLEKEFKKTEVQERKTRSHNPPRGSKKDKGVIQITEGSRIK
jgi:hypothetical protein